MVATQSQTIKDLLNKAKTTNNQAERALSLIILNSLYGSIYGRGK